ncbi:MAG: hypothetical protein ABI175_09060, partial [Polyangiales bacterium]
MDRRNDPAEPLPLVAAEPVALSRRPSLRDSWFDAKPEHSVSSSELAVRDSQIVVATPRNSSWLCGAFVGLVAAAAMIVTAMVTSHADVARAIGTAITKGTTGAESAVGIGAM